MDLPYYPLTVSADRLVHSFFSLGPRGALPKIIRYTRLEVEDHIAFNLSLGDVVSDGKQIRENVVSNNADKDRIFRTVAESVTVVCEYYPQAYIQIRGSSQARNRLYQMAISSYLKQICLRFEVYGLVGEEWEVFRKDQRYAGFLLHSRN